MNTVKPSELKALIELQNYRCALTGEELTPATATVDHCVPLSRGGVHALSNAQVILDYVNRAKGQMTNAEFIDMCRSVTRTCGIDSEDDTQLDV